ILPLGNCTQDISAPRCAAQPITLSRRPADSAWRPERRIPTSGRPVRASAWAVPLEPPDGGARLAPLGVSGARPREGAGGGSGVRHPAGALLRPAPGALGRLGYRADSGTVTYPSDKPSG